MNWFTHLIRGGRLAGPIVLMLALIAPSPAQVEPTLVSSVPPNFASGVSPTAAVVFTFSEPMDPETTTADFVDSTTFSSLPTAPVWSAGNTVLSCIPTPAFPASRLIIWSVSGENPNGDPLGGDPGGLFTTGTSNGGSGSGTNRITTFSLGKTRSYVQTSIATPALAPTFPYDFAATTALASNRTATAVSVALPGGGAVSNLFQLPGHAEQFFLSTVSTNPALLTTTYPDGNYIFNVQAATSNQQVTVNFPASLVHPPPPHVANFAAAQSVNAAQPFTLSWDAFQGGTGNDYIFVGIGSDFMSPDPGTTGALSGTATSILIPAGTLRTNATYDSSIGFYRAVFVTNGSSYATTVYRAAVTRFSLVTTGGSGGALVLTNADWNGLVFSFDVTSAVGQGFTVEYATLVNGPWLKLLSTNSPTGRVQIIDPRKNPSQFYRARNGL